MIHLAGTGVKTTSLSGGDDEHQLRNALEVTVVGMLRLIRASLPHLSAAKGNTICFFNAIAIVICLIFK